MTIDNRLPVIVYSKSGCVQCNATYRWFDSHDIKYKVHNLEESEQAADLVRSMGHQQAPVIFVPFDYENAGGKHWSGFRPDLLEMLM